MKRNSQEISDILSPEGIAKLSKGQILRFTKDDKISDYKITKIDYKDNKCWIIPINTYAPDEVKIIDKKEKLWKNKVK